MCSSDLGVRTVEVGYRNSVKTKVLRESLMLTDDENIIDIQFAVQYVLKDPRDYLFNNRSPDESVLQAGETAIREIVGKSTMDFVLQEGRAQVTARAQKLMQEILDRYKTGINISKVTMQNAQPPEQVQAAFDDAVKAGQDRERQKNEGQAYANDVIPKARGTAARLLEEAEREPADDGTAVRTHAAERHRHERKPGSKNLQKRNLHLKRMLGAVRDAVFAQKRARRAQALRERTLRGELHFELAV